MQLYSDCNSIEAVIPDARWNKEDIKSLSMHSIHTYPAKFPPFIASEAFSYASEEGAKVQSVADIFCGCGTVALESKVRGLSFWGCDLNPVAVLITKAKTIHYDPDKITDYYEAIEQKYFEKKYRNINIDCYENAPERLKYWFSSEAYQDLYDLDTAIKDCVTDNNYLIAFQCVFSSILKSASKWLQKSIKPQIDPHKKQADVKKLFDQQVKKFVHSVEEINDQVSTDSVLSIEQADFLQCAANEKIDLIVTSPPYVTSYEYADLHQLSSLWLGYTSDYRDLRRGSIGSTYFSQEIDIGSLLLNSTGSEIVKELKKVKVPPSKIKTIARYYSDMERAISKCAGMLNENGMALFVIGDSELQGVKLSNSEHLIEAMSAHGFSNIKVGKRTIEKCMCVPYRDKTGKFTEKSNSHNEIYHEEYIISGRIR